MMDEESNVLTRVFLLYPARLVTCYFLAIALLLRSVWELLTSSNIKQKPTGKKVLITGGRSPFTLGLIRMFHNSGHQVHIAETSYISPVFLSNYSRAVHKRHTLNMMPNQQPILFAATLAHICSREGIDLLIPTCEEIFWVSKGLDILTRDAPNTRVFVENETIMRELHNKYLFNKSLGSGTEKEFECCETELLQDETQFTHYVQELINQNEKMPNKRINIVLKPVYSRFASQTIVRPTLRTCKELLKLKKSNISQRKQYQTEWIAQEFIEGDLLCTYSVAQHGKLLAHTAYRGGVFTNSGAPEGGSITFEQVVDDSVTEWVQQFVASRKFTGQIAFDILKTSNGALYAIECNPRGTSGIHLFANCEKEFTNCFFDDSGELLEPKLEESHYQVTAAMFIWCICFFRAIRSWSGLDHWCRTAWKCRDAVWEWWDPLPWFAQFYAGGAPLWKAIQYKIRYVDVFTYDIEWHGE